MKILVCCKHGNNRSSCIGLLLKGLSHDVLNCGLDKNSQTTQEMLFNWAEKIIVVEKIMTLKIPSEYLKKTITLEMGEDKWGRSFNPDMMKLARKLVGGLEL